MITIRNKTTGETKVISEQEASRYGLAVPTPTPTQEPASPVPQDSNQGFFRGTSDLLRGIGLGGIPDLLGNLTFAGQKAFKGQNPFSGASNTPEELKQMFTENPFISEERAKNISGDPVNIATHSVKDAAGVGAYLTGAGAIKQLLSGLLLGVSDENATPESIAASGGLGVAAPQALRKLLELSKYGPGGIINNQITNIANKSSNLFPRAELYKLLEERVPQIIPEGNLNEAKKLLNRMRAEGSSSTLSPEGALLTEADINTKRKLLNKTYNKDSTIGVLQRELAKLLREQQAAASPQVGKLLPAERFFSFQLPELATSLPFGVGPFLGKAGNVLGSLRNLIPSPGGKVGTGLQEASRYGVPSLLNQAN